MSTDPTGQIPASVPEPSIQLPGVPMPPQGVPMQGMPMPPYQQQMWPGQPQPGQYPGMPMYAAMPKPPSPLSDPKLFMEKMPTVALIAAGGIGFFALMMFITTIIAATASSGGAIKAAAVLTGLGLLALVCVSAVVIFAILMSIRHFADLRQAKLDAMTSSS